ncbi:glycoside hydrolase family 3 C-terminal domain-containing protein [Sinosporangium siamense]|uniref:Exo-alpha-(1->6)-L-arabinopyranosidase n=1 Tax=Sinosporangium siamense TaxID=1367973 RepID=A0A919V6G3_9ACTN|nr:glycoside hydrolase family 3 C-terminal domain-containing protein [Sinosporangium siamense]GII92463.1 glycosyl hydrolase [Sinosporangium siamense]
MIHARDLDRLTLEERASLTTGSGLWTTRAIERAGIPELRLTDGPHGVRWEEIPATCFPPAVALGSSWDAGLLVRVGAALGAEAAAFGVHVLLGPGVNIKRSPLCGRNFEYLSEDPHVSGVLGAALIEGVQSTGVAASLKHFAVNNQETNRMQVSAEVDERTLREIYLAAFEYAVKTARPWTVMCSYNRINGEYASQNHWLLTEVLRDEWGYDGMVVSDWGAVGDRVAALRAGLDLEMPATSEAAAALVPAAVRGGDLAEADVDRSARRVLQLADRVTARPPAQPYDDDMKERHHRLAREVAGQCAVLLKNDGVLPLAPAASLAVVGELARTPRYQGAGSSKLVPTRLDDALTELRAVHTPPVPFAAGYRLDGAPDPALVAEARAAAEAADVTVVFLGLPDGEESEGYDRTHLDLPAAQLAAFAAVAETATRVVVVLSAGGVVTTTAFDDRAGAILAGWLLGQAGGGAVADVLTGAVNPSGRLTETIPLRLEDTPSYLNFPGDPDHVRYGEGVFVGYRYHDAVDGPVAYPFGHGLSYTTFAYSDLTVVRRDDTVEVSAVITNTGTRQGSEVPQVYVSAPAADVRRPLRELRAFTKVTLAPGESTTVVFSLGSRDFAYFHPTRRTWTVEEGTALIFVGASSRDLRLSGEVKLEGNAPESRLTPDSSLAEWMATPGGRAVLSREMQPPAGSGLPPSRFLSDHYVKTVGSVPLSRLARIPGAYLDLTTLAALADEANG